LPGRYDGFIKPTLLISLFAPPEELSAAVTMGCLYFYALQHQNSFDVCWCGWRLVRQQQQLLLLLARFVTQASAALTRTLLSRRAHL